MRAAECRGIPTARGTARLVSGRMDPGEEAAQRDRCAGARGSLSWFVQIYVLAHGFVPARPAT